MSEFLPVSSKFPFLKIDFEISSNVVCDACFHSFFDNAVGPTVQSSCVAGVDTVSLTMVSPELDRRVHSIFRSKTNVTQDSSESESARDRNTVASGALPKAVQTRSASTRNTPSPSKMCSGTTVRGRRLKQAPCLAIDTTGATKENDDAVSESRPVKPKTASWNRDAALAEQSGWIPAKIRELGTGRVALLQPLTADELVERKSLRTRKKQNKPDSVNNWRGKFVTTQSKNLSSPAVSALTTDSETDPKICSVQMFPSSPAVSALTTDSEANPKSCPLRVFRRRRPYVEE
jgi:hypothetical protein